jgi:EamA domain-containing membrane protein RarD
VQYTQKIPSAKNTIDKTAINKTKNEQRTVKCVYTHIHIYIHIYIYIYTPDDGHVVTETCVGKF